MVFEYALIGDIWLLTDPFPHCVRWKPFVADGEFYKRKDVVFARRTHFHPAAKFHRVEEVRHIGGIVEKYTDPVLGDSMLVREVGTMCIQLQLEDMKHGAVRATGRAMSGAKVYQADFFAQDAFRGYELARMVSRELVANDIATAATVIKFVIGEPGEPGSIVRGSRVLKHSTALGRPRPYQTHHPRTIYENTIQCAFGRVKRRQRMERASGQ